MDGSLSERIRTRREGLALTQLDLLYRMRTHGVRRTPPTLAAWERGRLAPRADELAALAAALETTVSWLIGENKQGESNA